MTADLSRPLEPLRVLLLDDNKGMRRILRSLLAGFGCARVDAAETVQGALTILETLRPDLVITDYQLETGTGLDFVAALRGHEVLELRTTPVLMITSHSDPEETRRFVAGGVDEVLAKPIQPEALYAQIASLATERRPFVQAGDFFGPDRRREDSDYKGPDRRRRGDDQAAR